MIPLLAQGSNHVPQASPDADLFTQVAVWTVVSVVPTIGSLAVFCGKKFGEYLQRIEEQHHAREKELLEFRKAEEARRSAEVVSIAEAIHSGRGVNRDVAALRNACCDLIELIRTSRPDWTPEQISSLSDMQAALARRD